MKKILLLVAVLLFSFSCSANNETFKGKEYRMMKNDAVITLGFSAMEDRFFGAVVNRYFGTYKQNESNIEFMLGGATMMMGTPSEMKAEQAYLSSLAKVVSFSLKEKGLILKTSDGQEMIFEEIGTVNE